MQEYVESKLGRATHRISISPCIYLVFIYIFLREERCKGVGCKVDFSLHTEKEKIRNKTQFLISYFLYICRQTNFKTFTYTPYTQSFDNSISSLHRLSKQGPTL